MEEYMENLKKASGEIWKAYKTVISSISRQNLNDEWWQMVIDLFNNIIVQYEHTDIYEYAKGYCNVLVCEIERIYKERKNDGK